MKQWRWTETLALTAAEVAFREELSLDNYLRVAEIARGTVAGTAYRSAGACTPHEVVRPTRASRCVPARGTH